MSNSVCRCGSTKQYSACCEPFIKKKLKPETAEQLMRSRFVAFCLSEHQYLIDTHHTSQRKANDLSELNNSQRTTTWVKLIIHQTDEQANTVGFSAFFNENDQFFELRETSQFTQEQGQWFYVNRESHIQPSHLKFKWNEDCWCSSGKKFKHCHSR